MPIGAYDPWTANHATPEQSHAMTNQMGAACILPMHWGTFIQSEEPTREPIAHLQHAMRATAGCLALKNIGQTWTYEALQAQAKEHPGTTSG